MKFFAQFFHNSTGYVEGSNPPVFRSENVKLIEACGTDGIVKLDGRSNLFTMLRVAHETCQKRKYLGYQIIAGETLLSAKPQTQVYVVTPPTQEKDL